MNDIITSITFYQGEERVVDAEIGSKIPNETIVATNATWTLTDRSTNEIADSGVCDVDGRKLSAFFGSNVKGRYVLKVTAQVGRETIKQRLNVSFV